MMVLKSLKERLFFLHLAIFSIMSAIYVFVFSAKADLNEADARFIALLANYQIRDTSAIFSLRSDLLFGLGSLQWGYLWKLEPVTLIGVLTGEIYNPYPVAIVFSIGLFICSFCFARKFRAGIGVSILSAYLVPVSTVWSHAQGLTNNDTYRIIPPVLSLLIFAMLLAICIESIDATNIRSLIIYATLIFVISIYILAVYPQMAVCTIFFVAATTLGGLLYLLMKKEFRIFKIRVGVLSVVVVALWLTGALAFILGYYKYSAYTQNAIPGVTPMSLRVFIAPSSIFNAFFYNDDKYVIVKQIASVVILIHLVTGLFKKASRDLLFYCSLFVVVFVLGYRLWQTRWTHELGPQLNYLTWFLVPIYATSLSSGFSQLLAYARKYINNPQLVELLKTSSKSYFYIPIAIFILIATTISEVKDAGVSPSTLPATMDKTEQFLAQELGVSSNSVYRGRLINGEDWAEYPTLVQGRIPALNDYSHLLSPIQYAFTKHFFFDPGQIQSRNHLVYANTNVHLYSLLGAKYLRLDWLGSPLSNLDETNSYPAVQYSENDFLVELKNVNLGNYSPTRLHVARSLDETFQIMDRKSFAPMEDVVVYKQLDANFVRVGKTELSVDSGDLRIVSESAGKTLIILPIEFSHCLKFESNNKNSNLIDVFRVDGILTGLIFANELDVTTKYRYGVFTNNKCRLKDLADYKFLTEDQK